MLDLKYRRSWGLSGQGTKFQVVTLAHFTTRWPCGTTRRLEKEIVNSHFILNNINAHLFHLARWQIANDQWQVMTSGWLGTVSQGRENQWAWDCVHKTDIEKHQFCKWLGVPKDRCTLNTREREHFQWGELTQWHHSEQVVTQPQRLKFRHRGPLHWVPMHKV